jgi:predicted ester cyclase
MSETNKSLVRDLLAAWNAHDVDRACSYIGDACNGDGPAGFRRELTAFLAAFPDATVEVDDVVGEGDKVATLVTIRGTHRGTLLGVAPTGRSVHVQAFHLFRCASGRIVQRRGQLDRFELLTQLGLTLSAGHGPTAHA